MEARAPPRQMEALQAAHAASLALHEVRMSPDALLSLGLASCAPRLLLAERIPCFASADDRMAPHQICVPPWLLDELGLAQGDPLDVRVDHPLEGTPPRAHTARLAFRRAARADAWADSRGEAEAAEAAEEEAARADPLRALREAAGEAAAAAAVRRQLRGLWLREGRVAAVRCVGGVAVLRVLLAAAEGEGAATVELAPATRVELVDAGERPPPPRRGGGGGGAHGEAMAEALRRHARRALGGAAGGGEGAAWRGGHALLHGPPSNGKRRAIGGVCAEMRDEAGAAVARVSCARLLAADEAGEPLGAVLAAAEEVRGEGEGRPTVVHVEALELLCGMEGDDPSAASTRVAAALLAWMRSLAGATLVLGSVSDVRRLPQRLRSHGAFETIFHLPPPTAPQRTSFLEASLGLDAHASAPLDRLGLASRLSERTSGYTIGDLLRLVRTAHAISADGRIEMPHLERALREVLPSASEQDALRGAVGAASVGGYDALQQRLARLVEWPQSPGAPLRRLGVHPPSGALLFGPPGNGKTLLVQEATAVWENWLDPPRLAAQALATRCGVPAFVANASRLFGQYVGETELRVRQLFRQAREAAPSILLLDELDALGASRSSGGDSGGGSVAERALSTLLNEMDGVGHARAAADSSSAAHVFLIGCTNRPGSVDSALLRPGRLEQHLFVGPPDQDSREKVLNVHLRTLQLAPTVDVASLACKTERFSCAALAALCREATLSALKRYMEVGADNLGDSGTADHLIDSLRALEISDSENTHSAQMTEEQIEITPLDFECGMSTVCHSMVPSVTAYTRMMAEYEAFMQSSKYC
ncbi:hypothetical protein AB1Y20_022316 [Prymnesium parvum]|uniref:AAA+ ATPase domain-containing protein n=1 Tax=Prymnesium parvum TaxID=97485 RepID=A0AB34JIK9_PRYPA